MGVGRRVAARARQAARAGPPGMSKKRPAAFKQQQQQLLRHKHDIVVITAPPSSSTGPATTASAFHEVLQSNPNPVSAGLYRRSQRILLVGEGDFSFTLALATAIGGDTIVATSYDKQAEVLSKYR